MTDKTERDALVAKLREANEHLIGAFEHHRAITEAMEALAAPPAASVDVENLRKLAQLGKQHWKAGPGYYEEIISLIDSAGGAKCTGADCKPRDGGTLCQSCGGDITPQPVEGDCPRCGCVDDGECLCPTQPAEGDGAVVSHHLARVMLDSLDDYARMDTGVDAYGPRDTLERYIAQQEARPAATAAVPDGWKLVPIVATPSMDAAGKKALSDNGVTDVHDADALVCFAAMLAAAPTAPAVVPGYAVELLTNIKRACVRGRNVANMEVEANFVATCDHIESLADQALAALNPEPQP